MTVFVIVLAVIGGVLSILTRLQWLPHRRPPRDSSFFRRTWLLFAIGLWLIIMILIIVTANRGMITINNWHGHREG